MATVELSDSSEDNKFHALRAQAIEQYANVEQSLASLFSALLGTTPDKGGVVFFRITNASSRNKMITALLKKSQGDRYDAFWHGTKAGDGLLLLIRHLDQARNEIVHWHMVHKIYPREDGGITRMRALSPPNFWNMTAGTRSIDVGQLIAFIEKADFVHRALNIFHALITESNLSVWAAEIPWQQIFEQPIAYPPPDTHPLSRNYTALQNPPQASGD
jgi:hypothetical protein